MYKEKGPSNNPSQQQKVSFDLKTINYITKNVIFKKKDKNVRKTDLTAMPKAAQPKRSQIDMRLLYKDITSFQKGLKG